MQELLLEEAALDEPEPDARQFLQTTLNYLASSCHSAYDPSAPWIGEDISNAVGWSCWHALPGDHGLLQVACENGVPKGEIVELGCWLGKSTCCLAEGLLLNPTRGLKKVRVFDSFRWQEWMERLSLEDVALPRLSEGESFYPYFKQNIAQFIEVVECVSVNIRPQGLFLDDRTWTSQMISICIVDTADTYDHVAHLWSALSDRFILDHSIIVFNQFGNARSEGLRQFCCDLRTFLMPLHKPLGSVQAFLYKTFGK